MLIQLTFQVLSRKLENERFNWTRAFLSSFENVAPIKGIRRLVVENTGERRRQCKYTVAVHLCFQQLNV